MADNCRCGAALTVKETGRDAQCEGQCVLAAAAQIANGLILNFQALCCSAGVNSAESLTFGQRAHDYSG
jgi:hypothetical protein